MVAKRAAAADDRANARLPGATAGAAEPAPAAPPAPLAPKAKFDVGVVAAMGVAVGGITAALAAVFAALVRLEWWVYPILVVVVMLLISGPSMVIAWLKLRQRNLGPVLDANGWAVNALTKVNIPLGSSLTQLATIPPGSERSTADPFAPKRSPWPRLVAALLLIAAVGWGLYRTNLLHRWVPWIPAHHEEAAPPAANGFSPSATSGAPGTSIEITVASGATTLFWCLEGAAPQPLPVAAGKATLAIPADAKPGSRITVMDTTAGIQCSIEVAAPGK